MIHGIWQWMQFNFWLSVVSMAAGLVIISPLLLIKRVRQRFLGSRYDTETIGFIGLIVAVIAIGVFNHLRR